PFATLVQRLQPQRDPRRSPLFQVMFALQKTGALSKQDLGAFALGAPGAEMQLGDMVVEPVAMEQTAAQFDLTLAMGETGVEMVASFEYNTDLCEAATIGRVMRHFERLARECIVHPQQPLAELPLLTDEDSRQLVEEWNQTESRWPACDTVLELLEAQAQKTPQHPAVIFESKSLTYREIGRASCRERG